MLARFWWLSLTGKMVAVIVVVYGAGWVAGSLGFHDLARQLGTVALYILGLLLTAVVIRWLWASFTGSPGE
ncbi:MAG: hypothetical protein QOF85_491 [Solirubrobacterales bacterium]|jgi:type IV secretory pathway VirB2 component (pilin)|nr:hypothetical protein [Solirubrobacterales bacterium]